MSGITLKSVPTLQRVQVDMIPDDAVEQRLDSAQSVALERRNGVGEGIRNSSLPEEQTWCLIT